MAFTRYSDRPAGQVIFLASAVNIDGDQALQNAMPSGTGPVLVLEVIVDISGIATMMTTPELHGPYVRSRSSDATTIRDFMGIEPWIRVNVDQLCARVHGDQPLYLDQGDLLEVRFEEVDTNASPGADINIFARCRLVQGSS